MLNSVSLGSENRFSYWESRLGMLPLWHKEGRFETSELQVAQSNYRNEESW
jgi:hypothetical protein